MQNNHLSDQDLRRLERLAALRNQGALTEREFEAQKASIIATARVRHFAVHADARDGKPVSHSSSAKLWLAVPAIVVVAIIAGLMVPPRAAQRDAPPSGLEGAPTPATEAATADTSPFPFQLPQPLDTSKELQAAGWIEDSNEGDGCSMERLGEKESGLRHILIYHGGLEATYELGFTSALHQNDTASSVTEKNAYVLELKVLFDHVSIPATLQNHYGDIWEVEIPLTGQIRSRIARARSIGLQFGSEVIALEEIQPNPTSIATIERCLTP